MTHFIDSQTIEGLLFHNSWRQGFLASTLANATTTLTSDSPLTHYYTGTTVGQILRLSDATTIGTGHVYRVINAGTQSITIQNNAGGALISLIPNAGAEFTLVVAGSAAGTWMISANVLGTASGIINYYATATASFAPGTALTLVTGMTVTPVSGTYAIWYHGSCQITTNNIELTTAIYNGGVLVTDSTRVIASSTATFNTNHATQSIVQFNGTNACEIRVSRTGGAFTATGRSLILMRLGA